MRPRLLSDRFLVIKRLLKCSERWSERMPTALFFVYVFLSLFFKRVWPHFGLQILPWEVIKKWPGMGGTPPVDPEHILVFTIFAPQHEWLSVSFLLIFLKNRPKHHIVPFLHDFVIPFLFLLPLCSHSDSENPPQKWSESVPKRCFWCIFLLLRFHLRFRSSNTTAGAVFG